MWIPPAVERQMLAERKEAEAEMTEMFVLSGVLARFNKQLKQIDPHLELVQAQEHTRTPGIRPGFFHVLRHNPGAPTSVEVLEGPNGEWVEPGSNVFEMLERSDMWSDRAMAARRKRDLKDAKAKEREIEGERADRVEELTQRLRSMNGSQILVQRDLG